MDQHHIVQLIISMKYVLELMHFFFFATRIIFIVIDTLSLEMTNTTLYSDAVQLSEKLTFHEFLLPVCLPTPNMVLKPNISCTVIGWGRRNGLEGNVSIKYVNTNCTELCCRKHEHFSSPVQYTYILLYIVKHIFIIMQKMFYHFSNTLHLKQTTGFSWNLCVDQSFFRNVVKLQKYRSGLETDDLATQITLRIKTA